MRRHVDCWPLFARLVRTMTVVMPRELGQDPPEAAFAIDQQVVQALAVRAENPVPGCEQHSCGADGRP
jgi:hypothetical protein